MKPVIACAVLAALILTGCSSNTSYDTSSKDALTYDEAVTEMDTLVKTINLTSISKPILDIYSDDTAENTVLADINTFPVTTEGDGQINIEIAAATEISNTTDPDDWLNVAAAKFNKEAEKVNGKTVSVSVRKITSGEVVTYMTAGAYKPQAYIPSNEAWGLMLDASGIQTETVEPALLKNTAGLLIKQDVYDSFIEKYKEATVKTVMEATLNGDISFAYTNPYTSSTGLNILTAMLKAFDEKNPLSTQAQDKLLEYQKQSPPVAYTTAVLRNQAAKGVINAMVMEEQAYIMTPSLSDFVYIPAGIRHDHPVYTFSYVSDEEKQVLNAFVEFCKTEAIQKLGTDKGFNRHPDYVGEDSGLDGAGYLAAQKVWKQNKNGGSPTVAVFVADTSGSMDGTPLASLKESLIAGSSYIDSDNYIGLVSYSGTVTKHLDIAQFDAKQRAYFSGEVKALKANGQTATYDAILIAMKMLTDAAKDIPNAKLMLFVLTDGQTNEGYNLQRIKPIVKGLHIPVYTIAYNYTDTSDLTVLSEINEAANIKADSDNIINELRNLFNVQA